MAKNTVGLIAKILAIVGGLNWGLVGIGAFAKMNLNLVNLIFGSIPTLESIVYIVVGLAAGYMIYEMVAKK